MLSPAEPDRPGSGRTPAVVSALDRAIRGNVGGGPAILAVTPSFTMPLVDGLNLFALLAMGHFLADFGLQNDRMAVEKCPGRDVTLPWQWWLAAHAAIHGFLVALLTGVPLLGVAEWILHAGIDVGKCRKRYGLKTDQLLHLLSKLLWAGLATTCLA